VSSYSRFGQSFNGTRQDTRGNRGGFLRDRVRQRKGAAWLEGVVDVQKSNPVLEASQKRSFFFETLETDKQNQSTLPPEKGSSPRK